MAQEKLEKQQSSQSGGHVNSEGRSSNKQAAAAPKPAAAPASGGGGGAQGAAPVQGGSATAFAPSGGSAGYGVTVAKTAPPVSAGATGNNAGNNGSSSAGKGGSPISLGSGGGNPLTVFMPDLAELENKAAKVAAFKFMGKSTDLTFNKAQYNEGSGVATFNNINIGSVSGNGFTVNGVKINSISFNANSKTLMSVSLSSGAISSNGGFFKAGSMTAKLGGGQGEYGITVGGPSISVLGQNASASGAQLKIGSGGQLMGVEIAGAQSGEHKAGKITIGPSGAYVESLDTKINLFGGSRGVKFSSLGVSSSGQWNGAGQLENIGQASLMGGKVQATNIAGQIGLANNKITGSVNAGLSIENGLVKADQMSVSINDKSVQGTVTGVTASILGQNLSLQGASVSLNNTGDITNLSATGMAGNNFSVQGFQAAPGSVKLTGASVTVPPVLSNAIELKVAEIAANGGSWSAQGSIAPSGPVSFMENKLTIPDLKAELNVAGSSLTGSLSGNVAYNDPGRMITANGLGTINISNTPDFQLANGTVQAELAGMKFAGEGVQISTAPVGLSIGTGTIEAPIFNGAVAAQISNGRVDGSGFNFDSFTIASGQPIDVSPNFQVEGSMTLVKNGQSFEVKLENGSLALQGLPGGVSGSGGVNMTYSPGGGFSGEIIAPQVSGNFGQISSSETISFSDSGFSIASGTAQLNAPTGQMIAEVTNVTYAAGNITIGALSTKLPPILNTEVNIDATNVSIGEGGLNATINATVSDQTIALGGGVLNATNLQVNATLENGQYNVDLIGNVDIANLAGFDAEGEVKINVENGTPNVTITNGTVVGETSVVKLDGTGLSYDSATQVVGIESVNVEIPHFQGGEVSGTGTGITISATGFEGTVDVIGSNVQVVPGLEITNFEGNYTNTAGVESLQAKGDAIFIGAAEMVNIKNAEYTNDAGVVNVNVEQVDLKTPFLHGLIDGIQYDHAANTFSAAEATLNTQGLEALGGPIAKVTGLQVSPTGVQVSNLEAGLKVGENIVTLTGDSLNVPYSGMPTGNLKVTATDPILIANGVIMVGQAEGDATLTGSGIDFTMKGLVTAGLPLGGMQASGEVEVNYSSATQAFSGQVANPVFTSDMVEVTSTETATFDQTGFQLGSAEATIVTNSASLQGTMTNISADASGLKIGTFEAQSIQVLDAQANLTLTDITIGSGGLSVGSASTQLMPNKISIVPNFIEATSVTATATFANNNVDFSLEGTLLATNQQNLIAEGNVKITIENEQPNVDITNGTLIGNSENVDLLATDLTFTSTTNTFTAGNVDLKYTGFKSGEAIGNATGVTINENGFEGTVTLTGNEIEVVTGVKVANLQGEYTSQAGSHQIKATGSASVGPNEELKINTVDYEYNNGVNNISAKDITLDTAHFSGSATDAAFDQAASTFSIATATVDTKGMETLGSPQATIEGLEVTDSGIMINSLTSDITLASLGSGLSLKGSNLQYPYGGAPSGMAEITTTAPISVANGGLVMEQIKGAGDLSDAGWTIELFGGLKAATAGGGLDVRAQGALTYSSTEGFSGEIQQAFISTDFVLIESTGTTTFDDKSFEMPGATAVVTSAGQELANGEVTDVQFGAEGLSVGEVKATMPDLLGAEVEVSAKQLTAGAGGLNVAAVDASFSTDSIDLVPGYLKANNLQGDGSFVNNDLSLKISAGLDLSGIEGATASGTVEVLLENGKPTVNILDGQASVTQLGATIEATGLDYSTDTQEVTIQQAELKVPEFKGGEVTGNAKDMKINASGFEGTVALTGSNIEVAKNVTIDSLTGEFSNVGGTKSIKAEGSSTVTVGSNQIQIQRVGFENVEDVKKISAEGIKFSTNYFDAEIANAEYEESTGTFTMAQATIATKNMDQLGNPTGEANDLKVNEAGVEVGSLKAGLSWEGKANAIQLEGSSLKFPFGGGPSGTATVTSTAPIQIAKGAFELTSGSGEATLNNEGWAFQMTANMGMKVPNAEASGTVDLTYDKANGVDVKVQNGSLGINMPSMGLSLDASNINYDHPAGVLTVGTATATLSKLAGGISGTVSNLSVSGTNFNFDRIEMTVGSGIIEVVPGIKVKANKLGLSKTGSSVIVDMAGGIDAEHNAPMVKASGNGQVTYDLGTQQLKGSASAVSIETAIFKTTVGNVTFSNTGFSVGQAELNIGENLDPALFKKYIPGFQPWMLEVVAGVKFIGKDISYKAGEGLKVGAFYPDIPPVPFSFLGGALKGTLDIKNQKGNVAGEKKIALPNIKSPEIKVPIPGVPLPVFATIGVGVSGNASIGANMALQKKGDVWAFNGGLSASAQASLEVFGGLSVDFGIASASAKVGVSANVNAKGSGNLGGGLRYNPKQKKVELVGAMSLNYNLQAELVAKLKLALEARIGFLKKELPIDLASWQLGSMQLSGSSTASDMGQLLGNLKNKAKVIGPGGKVIYQK